MLESNFVCTMVLFNRPGYTNAYIISLQVTTNNISCLRTGIGDNGANETLVSDLISLSQSSC